MLPETPPHVLFESAADAQQAFYDAFQRCDIEDMMSVWANDENAVCVHPGGPRLYGVEEIRDSWMQVFKNTSGWDFRLSHGQCVEDELLSIHQLQENIYVNDRLQGIVIATNVFHNTSRGWRMMVHHASPAPETAGDVVVLDRHLH